VFSVPHGVALSAVFLGLVFGFLSFAGFEAASTLGEETTNPRRDIPRAILGVAIFGGIYFVIVTAVEAMGFGTSTKGVGAFVASQSLIGDLGRMYVSSWIGNIITIGAMVSAFSCALACCVGASRLVFALSRDGLLHDRLARVAPGRRTPTLSTAAVVLAAYVIIAFTWFVPPTATIPGSAGTPSPSSRRRRGGSAPAPSMCLPLSASSPPSSPERYDHPPASRHEPKTSSVHPCAGRLT
jgi:amino acid transporter